MSNTSLIQANNDSEVIEIKEKKEVIKTPPELERKIKEICDDFMKEGEDLLLNELPKEILRLTEQIEVKFLIYDYY